METPKPEQDEENQSKPHEEEGASGDDESANEDGSDGDSKQGEEQDPSHNSSHDDEMDQTHRQDHKEEKDNVPGNDFSDKKKRKVHKLSMTETENFNAKLKRRGVIYIARIPPKMTPTKIKRLLQEVVGKGVEVTRVFLMEEDATVRKRRRKEFGGNGSKRYIEGWVEFGSKKVAKHVALSLNNTPISNQKRNAHFGDLWNLKYLPKFQWSHLTEKVAYERRVKEQKLRLETLQARKETAAYKQLVETGQKLDKIEARLQRKRGGTVLDRPPKRKTVKQVQPMDDGAAKASHKSLLKSLV